MRAEMAERMLDIATRDTYRIPPPPQTPVTVIPMVFPMPYPQQVFAPTRRRGSHRSAVGPTPRPNGSTIHPGVPPVIPMPGPPGPPVSVPLVTTSIGATTAPGHPTQPLAPQSTYSTIPVVSTPVAPPTIVATHPMPAPHVTLNTSTTPTAATMTSGPIVTATTTQGITIPHRTPVSIHPSQSFLTHPGLSHHPSWHPLRSH